MSVPKHEVVVDVFVTIEVAELAARGFGNKDRIGVVGAVIAGDASGRRFRFFLCASADFGVRRSKASSSFCNAGYIVISKNAQADWAIRLGPGG